ncbi:MAG: farnesyl-diphosphate/geranylgeranyl-diphosphate synthase [uncultured archaeon A07HB70]|nr:MAG: farnesyl-diphosphate/geranylgeranyl-diphosphate synthase [uncultured archaeon A07HB70]
MGEGDGGGDRRARMLAAVAERRDRVNEAVVEDLPSAEPERLYAASQHLIEAGGKRLRPALVLLVAESLAEGEATVEQPGVDYRSFPAPSGGDVDVMAAAVGVELIHTFTLAHDDIMDDDDMRRGERAVHHEYDLSTAILAGDTLFAKGFELMSATGAAPTNQLAAIRRLAETCTRICEGQALDVEFEQAAEVLPADYTRMIELKTAVLYGAAAAIPAILLGADDGTVEALYQYGVESGTAFQIHDDVLDLTVPSDELGKARGSDLLEGKQTVITLHARQQGVDVDGLLGENPTEEEIDAAVSRLREAGSIEFAGERAAELTASSKERLSVLPEGPARTMLTGLADYLIERNH